ncbi:MAG: hypothetical protein QM698_11755 [Micropepsaceae bacterium]
MRRLLFLLTSLLPLALPAGAQGAGYGAIRLDNQSGYEIDLYVDNVQTCRAAPWSYCDTQATVGGHYVHGQTVEATPQQSNYELIQVEDGALTTWTLKGGTPPAPTPAPAPTPQLTGYGSVRFENQTVFDVDFYIDGSYACRASSNNYCTAQASVGTHYLSGKTVETPPREAAAEAVTIIDGGTSTYYVKGGGPAKTGYGTVEFRNNTAFQADFYLDGVYACRAYPASTCTMQASVGMHQATGRTVEDKPRSANGVALEVRDGQLSYYEMTGAGAPGDVNAAPAADSGGDAGPPPAQPALDGGSGGRPTPQPQPQPQPRAQPQPQPAPEALRYGSIVFDNQTALAIDFYIDNVYACRTAPGGHCEFPAISGRRNVAGVTREAAPRRIDGIADVPEGRSTTFGVVGQGADALPPR